MHLLQQFRAQRFPLSARFQHDLQRDVGIGTHDFRDGTHRLTFDLSKIGRLQPKVVTSPNVEAGGISDARSSKSRIISPPEEPLSNGSGGASNSTPSVV